MEAGRGITVIDPKGDLIDDICDRVPRQRESEVIIVDPTDPRPVGINLLDGPPGEADLTADQVVGVFARRFGQAWGPRTDDIARASVLTLLHDPDCTLADLPALLSSPAFRRQLVGKVTDPTLGSFWQEVERWGDGERQHNIAPLLNKVRTVLLRKAVRGIVGQPSSVSLDRVLSDGRILLVALRSGLVGEDASALLGSLLFARLWAATQRRVGLPPPQRHPHLCIIDEFHALTAISTPLADVLALSRGYGLGLVLLHQHLGQLLPDIRQAVLANCRTKVVFAPGAADAQVIAREFAPWIDGPALLSLAAHEVVIGASVGTTQLPPCTATTLPPPEATGRGEAVRALSRATYGRDRVEVDRRAARRTSPDPPSAPIGRKTTEPNE